MNINFSFAKRLLALLLIAVLATGCSKNKKTSASNASAADSEGLSIISYEPSGTLPNEVKNPSIYVQFSEPVVPLAKLGEPSDKSDIISIEPALKGVFRWYGTSLLSFECADEVIPQTEYVVKINPSVKSINGNTLTGMNSFSFKTEELKLVSVVPGYGAAKKLTEENPNAFVPYIDEDDVPVAAAGDIGVFFNYPVDVDVVKSSIVVYDEDSKSYNAAFSKIKDTNGILLTIKEKMPENKRIDIALKSGAQAQKGFLKTENDQIMSFHTLLPLKLRDTNTYGSSYGKYKNPVYFYFSHQLAPKNLKLLASGIKTTPSMKVTEENVEISGSRVIVYGLPVNYEDTYSMVLPAGITDVYGRKTTETVNVNVSVPAAASMATFKDYGSGILEAQFAPKLAFQFQNILPGSYYTLQSRTKDQVVKTYNEPDIPKNEAVVETVDLEPFLLKNDGLSVGNVVFGAHMKLNNDWYGDDYEQTNYQTVQVTDLGVTVRYGYNKAVVLVSSLKTGEPIAGAKVGAFASLLDYNLNQPMTKILNNVSLFNKDINGGKYSEIGTGVTDQNGLAVIDFDKNDFKKALRAENYNSKTFFIEVVNNNDRVVFNPDLVSMWRYNTYGIEEPLSAEDEEMRVFMFTDRKLYKPGEKLTFRGIDRTQKLGELEPYVGEYTIEVKEDAWKAKPIKTFEGKTTTSGGFYHSLTLPSDLEPGDYVISYTRKLGDGKTSTRNEYFQIAFFERLRFQANASIADITYTRGDRIDASVAAEYLGGGSLAGCGYTSSWFREPCGFYLRDAKFDGYTFGPLQGYDSRSYLGNEEGTLSATGKGSTSITSGGESLKGMAYQYRSEIRVTDQSNQMIAASASTIVHPALFYIGLSAPANVKGFAKKGDKLDFKYQAVMPDGSAVADNALPASKAKRSINVELLREEWNLVQQMGVYGTVNTRYVRNMVSEQNLTVQLDKSGSFTVTPPKGGSYLLRMSCTDKSGNDVVTERRFYVIGSDWYWYGNQSDELTLTANKNSYSIGETAQIMLQSPLEKGKYLLTIEREGVFHQEILDIKESVTVLDIPVKAEYLPIAYVTLSTYSTRTGEPVKDFDTPDMNKPKGYFGLVPIHVDTDSVTFDVSIKSDKSSYRPGETAKFTLKATQNGKPLSGAELSFMAVDRGVIDLINYHVPNPVEYFYDEYHFPICTRGGDSRSMLIDPVVFAAKKMFGGDADGDDSEKMNERKNFDPTAVFEPYLVTGADGTVECTFTWPDNLTAYRITAVGVDGSNFAIAESETNVANPVSARDVVPSTLRLNDISEAGLVISNLQDTAQTLEIEAEIFDGIEKSGQPVEVDGIERVAGHASLIKDTKKSVTVQANSTSIVMFPLKTEASGFVTVQFTVRSKVLNEKVLKPIEIERPYVFETVTTTGSTGKEKNASAKELLVIPADSDNNQGNISITLDATRLGVLKEAVDYVFHYPYGCLEQRSSAIMPMVYFADYIKVLGMESEVKKPRKVVEAELKKWKNYQRSDGSFPYWPAGSTASFPVSVRIAEIAVAAKARDYDVKIDLNKLANYINSEYNKRTLNGDNSRYMKSYVNYVRVLLGKYVEDETIESIVNDDKSSISDLCYAGLMYAERKQTAKVNEVLKKVSSFMRPTTRGVDITNQNWSYWQFFGGEIETYALALKLYSVADPENQNVGRLVYQLLQLQRASHGYWKSTATTARVLDAFATYIEANNLEDTNFTAEALINGKKFVNGKFKGLGADPIENTCALTEDPVKGLPKDKEIPVEFTKNGTGDLFYTLSMKYAVSADKQMPRDEGIGVYCEYKDLATGQIVTGDKLVAGKTYKAHVVVSTTRDRTFVALRVPVPAGAEIQNAAFVTTGSFQEYEEEKKSDDNWWWDDYYTRLSNETIYENEVQYFWNFMGRGRQEVDFLFRAVRSGTYQTPSVTAECMYEPEIFGRSSGKVWIIE